jgi:DNA-directed RNA polymerase specialized sigma24 family protein
LLCRLIYLLVEKVDERTKPARDARHQRSVEKAKKLIEMSELMTVAQIAKKLGIRKDTAHKRIQRARRRNRTF